MRKIVFPPIFMLFILLATVSFCQAQSIPDTSSRRDMIRTLREEVWALYMYHIPEETSLPLQAHYMQNDPPLLKELTISPEKPGPDDEIEFDIVAENNPLVTSSEPLVATLYYSVDDGRTWIEEEMEEGDDTSLWHISIPPQPSGTTIHYFFSVMDDAENYYLEVPKVKVVWEDTQGGKWSDRFIGNYPAKIPDENKVYKIVSDDLDILSASFAHDENHYYFNINVEGKISGGTVSPHEIILYHIGIFLPQYRGSILNPDYILAQSDLAEYLQYPVVGLYDVEKDFSEIPSVEPGYYVSDGRLYMRIKKVDLKTDADFDYFRIICGTAHQLSPSLMGFEPQDVTAFMNARPVDRKLVVK